MPLKNMIKQIFIVCTFSVSPVRKNFITHIPIRIKKILGESVGVTFIYAGDVDEARLIENNIQVIRLNVKNDWVFHWRLFWALGSVLRKQKPDAMMNMNSHLHNLLLGIWGRYYNIRTTARVTGNLFYNSPQSIKGRLHRVWKRSSELASLASMHRIICLSDELRKNLLFNRQFSKKIEVLSPGIDPDSFPLASEESKDIDLLFVGRLEPVKNVDFALSVFCEMQKQKSNINFHLVGDGSLLKSLRSGYAENKQVYFHGYVPHAEVAEFLTRSKLLILCSHSEGFPNIILEAMLCKAIAAVTPVSDMSEIVGCRKLGYLIETNQLGIVANALLDLLNNESERKKICQQAFDYVQAHHSVDALRQFYLNTLFGNHVKIIV